MKYLWVYLLYIAQLSVISKYYWDLFRPDLICLSRHGSIVNDFFG